MATIVATLGPKELLAALREVSATLSDHAAALDRLELGPSWGEEPEDGTVTVSTPGTAMSESLRAALERAGSSHGFGALADAIEATRPHAPAGAGRALLKVLGSVASTLRNADRLDGERFAIGLEVAAEDLAPSDDGAHAGCLPAVVAAAADGALSALDAGGGLADVVIAAADDGLAELEAGPVNNPVLVERGVVDPTAAGFLLVLDSLASILTGEPLPAPPIELEMSPEERDGLAPSHLYRVTCRVEAAAGSDVESAGWLKSLWSELGHLERFEVSGDRWDVALSTAEPGRAIEAILDVGRPRELSIVAVPRAQ